MEIIFQKVLDVFNVFANPLRSLLSYIGDDSRRLLVTSIALFIGLMSLSIFSLKLYFETPHAKSEDVLFNKGLSIAQLESAAEFLEVCKNETQMSGKNKTLYCDFAKKQFIFQIATHGKSGKDYSDAVKNPSKFLDDYLTALIVNDGYPMMQAMLNSKKRRSENKLRNYDSTIFSVFNFHNFIRSDYIAILIFAICALCTVTFALHARRLSKKATNMID